MAARDGTATTLANVHRLDKGTSGLLLLSKTKDAAAVLGKQFKTRKVQKTYWAALGGKLAAEPVRVALTLTRPSLTASARSARGVFRSRPFRGALLGEPGFVVPLGDQDIPGGVKTFLYSGLYQRPPLTNGGAGAATSLPGNSCELTWCALDGVRELHQGDVWIDMVVSKGGRST